MDHLGPSSPHMSAPIRLDTRLSIHDVMPHTLRQVADILSLVDRHALGNVRLLVVPGQRWTADQIAVLRDWQASGHELAAHGWFHRARQIRGWRHRVHAALVSRDVAEHLALDANEIGQLMRDAAQWFVDQELGKPQVYVPPAWALGQIAFAELKSTGYRRVEITRGELCVDQGRLEHQALLGFEADTSLREHALRAWNRTQLALAQVGHLPLRIAIHPQDLQLRLGKDLRALMAQIGAPRPAL
ncbi:MAG: DUF2334 domain-containing protein [Oceanococcus sp.]|nr:MAG: DUF2334 domain-containing protein [Oceanococcus sp.]